MIVQEQTSLDDSLQAKGAFRDLGNALRSTGFPGFKWLDLHHYDGLTFFNKTIPCYHYVLPGKDRDSGADLIVAEAWINAETGIPVAYKAEGDLFVYHFGEPPREALVLPAQFSTAYAKLRQSLDRQKRLEADAAAAR